MNDEQYLQETLNRLRQIDEVLREPTLTLIDVISATSSGGSVHVPPWIAERGSAPAGTYILTGSLCCSTLQRLLRVARRFEWLERKKEDITRVKMLEQMQERIATTFASAPPTADLAAYAGRLGSQTFGAMNPLTASSLFWVLLNAGEQLAHSSLGFFSFFTIMWALTHRSLDGNRVGGASIEPWKPTAFVTSKCLQPIHLLWHVCTERARLMRAIADTLIDIDKITVTKTRDQWRLRVLVEQLVNQLRDISELAIDRDAFEDCAERLATVLEHDDTSVMLHDEVREQMAATARNAGETGLKVLAEADPVVSRIEPEFIEMLKARSVQQLKGLGLLVREGADDTYWADRIAAAERAHELCGRALQDLNEASTKLKDVKPDLASIATVLRNVAAINARVGDEIQAAGKPAARWCFDVLSREIAHGSAGNWTEFDASELVAALAVASRWQFLSSRLEIADAVKRAVKGSREDGSWGTGQPFFQTGNRLLGASTTTSEVVWTLASVVGEHPHVSDADPVLWRYVDWLERTRTVFRHHEHEVVSGWASDLAREERRVDLWATAQAINALLQIRDIVEFRLWQLTASRFTVIKDRTEMGKIDPVDLAAPPAQRLHHRLWTMARHAAGPEYASGAYSLVLHGPPGSSKTVMAEALATEMWRTSSSRRGRREPRLVRITPADFTGRGEAHLDARARFIFDLISHLRHVTVLFDEIDDLLRKRDPKQSPSFMKLVIPAMLNRLADLRKACPRQEICFIIATNYIDTIEPALYREGRIDDSIPVVYPDYRSREAVAQQWLESEADVVRIVTVTASWPWMRINKFCKNWRAQPDSLRKLPAPVPSPPLRDEYLHRDLNVEPLRKEYFEYLLACCPDQQKYDHLQTVGPNAAMAAPAAVAHGDSNGPV